MVEIKLRSDHPSSMEERISKRLNNSGDTKDADVVVKKGEGPTRAFTNIHHGGTAKQHGPDAKGEGDIYSRPRGVNNPKGEI
jgi:hypothetical protein